jgi:hypothetical protein
MQTEWVAGTNARVSAPKKPVLRYDGGRHTLIQLNQYGYFYVPGKKHMHQSDGEVLRVNGDGSFETGSVIYKPA